jgi:hypothetical protein
MSEPCRFTVTGFELGLVTPRVDLCDAGFELPGSISLSLLGWRVSSFTKDLLLVVWLTDAPAVCGAGGLRMPFRL